MVLTILSVVLCVKVCVGEPQQAAVESEAHLRRRGNGPVQGDHLKADKVQLPFTRVHLIPV